jgi:hypothetical protein
VRRQKDIVGTDGDLRIGRDVGVAAGEVADREPFELERRDRAGRCSDADEQPDQDEQGRTTKLSHGSLLVPGAAARERVVRASRLDVSGLSGRRNGSNPEPFTRSSRAPAR